MEALEAVPEPQAPIGESSETAASNERRFREAFLALQGPWQDARPLLDALYASDVRFRDALFRFNNKESFLRGNGLMIRTAREIRIELDSVMARGDELFAAWRFHYIPKFGLPMRAEGATHARFRDEQIVYQRDYWDIPGTLLGGLAGLFDKKRR